MSVWRGSGGWADAALALAVLAVGAAGCVRTESVLLGVFLVPLAVLRLLAAVDARLAREHGEGV